MLTISKAVTVVQATEYYRNEYTNAGESFSADSERISGRWHGRLAEQWDLRGDVNAEQYQRLCLGQHPETGEQLVQHVESRTYENRYGKEITTSEHRAGWDATFSAPKTVSLAAVAGGDERVCIAHRESVNESLDALERYAQARMGGNRPAETTGKIVAAKFEHDAARPARETGYAAPQLHTHTVVFNVTETEDGVAKPMQPLELYRSQQYATAVYRISLAERLQKLGYEVEVGVRTGAPEIKGFDPEYVRESSPRSAEVRRNAEEMKARLEGTGAVVKDGAGLKQAAARADRSGKDYDRRQMAERVRELEVKYDHQAQRLHREALARGPFEYDPAEVGRRAAAAVTAARDHASMLGGEVDRRRLMTDAIKRGLQVTTYEAVRVEFEARAAKGEFASIVKEHAAGRSSSGHVLQEEIEAPQLTAGDGRHEARPQPVAKRLSADEVQETFERLQSAGRVVELRDEAARLRAIVDDYRSCPEGTLVVAPADERLTELNQAIHEALRAQGNVGQAERTVKVYEERAEMKGTKRASAGAYVPDEDIIRFNRTSKVFDIKAGEYARVASVDHGKNLLTVAMEDGREVTYNPARLSGVSVFRETERAFSEGERVRFAAPAAVHRIAAGTFGTINMLEDSGLSVQLDSGRAINLGVDGARHLDYGYAVSDYAAKGCSVNRLIAHVEASEPDRAISRRMQSVAQFRGGAQVYTDHAGGLSGALERNVERQFATEPSAAMQRTLGSSAELSIGTQVEGAEQALTQGMDLGLML